MRTYNDKDFEKTNKKATVTFNGWDGKSYNGEAVNRAIYTNRNLPGKKFVVGYFKNSKCYHEITEETHPVTGANLLSFYTYFDPVEC